MIDHLTGLIWTKGINTESTYTWADANAKQPIVNAAIPASYCGYNDWHTANKDELRSLFNYAVDSSQNWLMQNGFINIQKAYMSSESSFSIAGTIKATNMYFERNIEVEDDNCSNTEACFILPVRGGL